MGRKLSYRRARNITLLIAITTLASNTALAAVLSQISREEDRWRLARGFGVYAHFAGVLGVFGFLGALREHPLSMTLFSSYLLLDSLLGAFPRLLLFTLHIHLLSPSSRPSALMLPTHPMARLTQQVPEMQRQIQPASLESGSGVEGEKSAYMMAHCAQVLLLLVVVGSMVLQFVGAICVRAYAKALWAREGLVEDLDLEYTEGIEVLGGDEEEVEKDGAW